LKILGLLIIIVLSGCQAKTLIDTPIAKEQLPKEERRWPNAVVEKKRSQAPVILSVDKQIYRESASIEFKFSEEMQRIAPQAIQYTRSPELECIWYWTDSRHLTCDITTPNQIKPASKHQILLGKGLYSLEGVMLEPYRYSFESLRPTIAELSVEWLSPVSPVIYAEFNFEIIALTLNGNLALIDEKGRQIPLVAFPATGQEQAFENSNWDKGRFWVLKPTTELTPDTAYSINQFAGIKTPLGALPSQANRHRTITSYGEFKFLTAECYSKTTCAVSQSQQLSFSSPISRHQIEACESELKKQGISLYYHQFWREKNSRVINIQPNFVKQTKRLLCLEKVTDIFNRKLRINDKIEVTTGNYNPVHHSPYSSTVVTGRDPLVLTHQSINHSSLKVSITEIDFTPVEFGTSYSQRALPVEPQKNEAIETDLLPSALSNSKHIKGSVHTGDFREKHFHVQKSNYNAIVQRSGNSLMVFISDIYTNTPLKNTRFKLEQTREVNNVYQVVHSANGRTDQSGVSALTHFPRQNYNSSLLFTLGNGEKFELNRSHQTYPDINSLEHSRHDYRQDQSEVFWGITNKPLYRPGDLVKFNGFLRKIDGAKLTIPELRTGSALFVSGRQFSCWRISRCDSFYINKKVSQNKFGEISGEFILPESITDGRYTISINSGQQYESITNQLTFDVANFKRQKVKVEVDTDIKEILTEQSFSATTRASYYSGGPYINANSQLTVTLKEADFNQRFPDFGEYHFSANSRDNPVGTITHNVDNEKLNLEGLAKANIVLPPSDINYGRVSIQSSVATDEGEAVHSRTSENFFSNKPYYVGIKKLDWWLNTEQTVSLDSLVVSSEGNTIRSIKTQYFLRQLESPWARTEKAIEHVRIPVQCENELIMQPSENSNRCIVSFSSTGYYELTAQIEYSDGSVQSSSTSHYLYNGNESSKTELVVQAPDTKLKIGELANFKLNHGLQNASALMIVHRGELLDYWWQPLEQGLNQIEFEVKEKYAPGFDLTVFVNYADLDSLKKNASANYAQVITQRFKVIPPARKELVKIEPLGDSYGPSDEIDIILQNQSESRSSVLLAVIDNSILEQMENNQYFDPEYSDLISNQLNWSSPSFFELTHRLYQSHKLVIEELEEMDMNRVIITGSRLKRSRDAEVSAPANFSFDSLQEEQMSDSDLLTNAREQSGQKVVLRQLFKDAAFWKTNILVRGKSERTVKVKLPDNLTEWKIIALSTSQLGDIDIDQKTFKTSKEIEVHANLPGQLTIGDKFRLQAEALTKHSSITELKLSAVAQINPGGLSVGEASKTFDKVKPFERSKLSFDLHATREGRLEVLSLAIAEQSNDAILLDTTIYSKNIKRQQSYYTLLSKDTQVSVLTPEEFSVRDAQLRFKLTGSVISNLQGTFDYMAEYPHQCWEQKLSRAIVANVNLQSSTLRRQESSRLKSQIADAVNSISQFQAPNGGMAFFGKSDLYVSRYLSAYSYKTINYLVSKGVEFPKDNLSKLRNYLVSLLEGQEQEMTVQLAILTISALSSDERNNALVDQYIPSFFAALNKLDIHSRSLLLDIVAKRPNYKKQRLTLRQSLLNDTRVTDKKRLFTSKTTLPWYLYGFEAKKYCAAISALVASGSEQKPVYQLVNAAFEQRRKNKGDFGNTLSNAYCAIAINDYVEAYEQSPNIGSYNLSTQNNTLNLNMKRTSQKVVVSLDKPLEVKIEQKKQGAGYLVSTLEYEIDASATPPVANGFSLERSYSLQRDGEWLELNQETLKQGDYVKVRLEVNNPLFRRFVALTDTLPGSFFALDENLASGAPDLLFEQLSDNYYFRERQLSPRTAKFYADYLPPGTHIVEYLVRVTHQGTFTALSAKVEEMYDDDVFATSEAKRLNIQ
jgi:uncharacterized protein YfaS (alpha-2-macroglobulin family)